ncbi:hypothetical protein JOF56_001029 [Kibdelosporangium banguiense]|uniref:PH domain-containing protein n=1 Tax=Kibdelosporangium banguiense TaxID=1365924 RepID=A0ABS4T889_9PSEU|nr:hypothetical protein [Kibdelosporangium banguiense]MBP2320644.1 hypothetical protein [Kibdelosporangium banguiense]
MFKWRRVGGTPVQVVAPLVFTAVGAAATLGVLFLVIRGIIIRGHLQPGWPAVLLVVLFLAAWTTFAFRMSRIGVFVSDIGVRNRSILRTQTIPWANVKRFETRPMIKGLGSSYAGMLRAHAVWILLRDSSALQTSLVFRDKTSFLPAKGMTKLGDVVAGPAFAAGEEVGIGLTDKAVQHALRELRAAQKTWGQS